MDKAETVTVREAAYVLGVSPMKIKSAIKNGTLPIGAVFTEDNSTKERTVIIKTRLEKWLRGEL